MEAIWRNAVRTSRLYSLAARMFLAIAMLPLLAPGMAVAAKRTPRVAASNEARVSITNVDAQPLRIAIDGKVNTVRLPSGRSVTITLDPREYVFAVSPVGQSSSSVRSALSIDLGPKEMATFDATTVAIVLRSRDVKPRVLALRSPAMSAMSASDASSPTPRGVSLKSALIATLGLAAAAAFVVSQLSIERERVLDERASARMQQIASQSLHSLPPLSMDFAARTRR